MRLFCHEVSGSVPVIFDYYVVEHGEKVRKEKELWAVMD